MADAVPLCSMSLCVWCGAGYGYFEDRRVRHHPPSHRLPTPRLHSSSPYHLSPLREACSLTALVNVCICMSVCAQPSSNMDPYVVTGMIVKTCCL